MNKHTPTPSLHSPRKLTRRSLLKLGLGAGITTVSGVASSQPGSIKALWTPQQTEGPFYPVHNQHDKDMDLTQIKGRPNRAKGQVVIIQGRVKDTGGLLLDNALVDIWQANTWGRYRHRKDPNTAPLDPNFQGWGQIYTDAKGNYRFKTILPGAYPAAPDWIRPPHIHFKVSKPGYYALTTQMYFPDHELNDIDLILNNLPEPQQLMVIAKRQSQNENGLPVFIFDIVLRPKN